MTTARQMQEAALTLENDRNFYDDYTRLIAGISSASDRRMAIRRHVENLSLRAIDVNLRELLRRYFDARYTEAGLVVRPVTQNAKAHLPDLPWETMDGSTVLDFENARPTSDPRPLSSSPPAVLIGIPSTTSQGINMNTNDIITIDTKTLINGQDAKSFSNEQVYTIIAAQEKRIKELEAIENKPKMLSKEIADRKAGVQKLVDYLDAQVPTLTESVAEAAKS